MDYVLRELLPDFRFLELPDKSFQGVIVKKAVFQKEL